MKTPIVYLFIVFFAISFSPVYGQDRLPVGACVVCGQKLRSISSARVFYHANRPIYVCSRACETKFWTDSFALLQKMDEMIIEYQKDSYPLETCVVSGNTLGDRGDIVDLVYGNQLIRFCSFRCRGEFLRNPHSYLDQLKNDDGGKGGDGDEPSVGDPGDTYLQRSRSRRHVGHDRAPRPPTHQKHKAPPAPPRHY